MDEKISIISPVYNVEDYLKDCVESILNQTYKNIELILIDDGSTDNSGKICDEYASKDNRVKIVHKKNGGLSSARNAGLDIATGDYIFFVDSDDFLYKNSVIEKIIKATNGGTKDLILLPYIKWYSESKYEIIDKKYDNAKLNKSKGEGILYSIKYDAFKACAWDKVVKKSIIDKNRLRFLSGFLSEDIDWCAELIINIETLACVETPVYVYRQRMGSITHKSNPKHLQDIYMQVEKWYRYSEENKDELMKYYLAHNYVMMLEYYNKTKDKNKKLLKDKIKELSVLLNYNQSIKVNIVKVMKDILGFDAVLLLLKIFR